MREIKFRAWMPKGYTRWGGGGLVMLSWQDLLDDLHSELNPKKSVMGLGMSHAEEGVVFMQFTGLKDKNGKEIYEGDIVYRSEHKGTPYTVEVGEGSFEGYHGFTGVILTKNNDGEHYSDTSSAQQDANDWVVFGNIYENPELLK